jgi:predicted ribosomally synthesized peptide with nif11-like leader
MSTAAARGFILRLKSDPEFFFEVAAIEDSLERLRFIRSRGFDCTAEEIADAFGSPPEVDHRLWREQIHADPHFRCEAEWLGDNTAVVTVTGELDLATADRLRAVLRGLRKRGITDHLAVDLTDCTFIDSMGLSVLIEAQHVAKSPLHVASCTDQNCQVLRITGLDNVFVIHDSREQALAALRRQGEG